MGVKEDLEWMVYSPSMVEPEDLIGPHVRLTGAGQAAADKSAYAVIYALNLAASLLTGSSDQVLGYGAKRCEYCGRKISVDRDNCRGCGAPY
jgi:hypothetical protein